MEQKTRRIKFANVTTMVMEGLTDIHLKVNKYPGVYKQFEFFPDHIEVKVFDQALVGGRFMHNGIEHIYAKKRLKSQWIPSLKQLWQLRQYAPDYVLLHGLYFPHSVFMLRLFLGKGTKIIVQDHANRLPGRWKEWTIKRADRIVEHYVFMSVELAKPWLDAGIISSSEKIIECPEGSTDFKRDTTIAKDPNAFLWVARLDANKDPLTILDAFNRYVKAHNSARLHMFFANKTLLQEVEAFIRKAQLGQNVLLHGEATSAELLPWYQRSAYFLMGSSKEGGSFALMEAMACGCIPIVTDIPANRKMLKEGKVGHLFPPKDVSTLTNILVELEADRVVEASRKVVEAFDEDLSFKAIAEKLSKELTKKRNDS